MTRTLPGRWNGARTGATSLTCRNTWGDGPPELTATATIPPGDSMLYTGDIVAAVYEAAFSYGSTGDNFYWRVGRCAQTRAGRAGLRAEGREAWADGLADGREHQRPTRRRVR